MRILLFSLFLIISAQSYAAHILGGTMSYEVTSVVGGNTTLAMTMSIYRDANSNGATFDSPATIGVFGLTNGANYEFLQTFSVEPNSVESLDFGADQECAFPDIIVELGTYVFEVVVPTTEYAQVTVAYQRCCRGPSIVNLAFPEETGIVISVDITEAGLAQVGEVMSFSNLYPLRSLPNESKQYDLAIDGDTEVRYELVPAQVAGGIDGVLSGDPTGCMGVTPDPQTCPPPYDNATYVQSDTSPFGFSGVITLGEEDALMDINISQVGLYVISVKATHSLDGQVLSRMYQQFTHTVTPCVLGVQDDSVGGLISYPSPVRDEIYISVDAVSIHFYDFAGRLIKGIRDYTADQPIDVSDMRNGVYLGKGISAEGHSLSFKFIVGR